MHNHPIPLKTAVNHPADMPPTFCLKKKPNALS
jgi:hypothetical protein